MRVRQVHKLSTVEPRPSRVVFISAMFLPQPPMTAPTLGGPLEVAHTAESRVAKWCVHGDGLLSRDHHLVSAHSTSAARRPSRLVHSRTVGVISNASELKGSCASGYAGGLAAQRTNLGESDRYSVDDTKSTLHLALP